jgi:DNA-binding winged helix-turn-helix (wHTH) protein
MVAMLREEDCPGAPIIIQVDTDPTRIACVRCKAELPEAVYWRDTYTGWRLLRICAYCRHNTVVAERRRQQDAALTDLYDMASNPVEGRRAYVRDGQLRCAICSSTTYREVALIRVPNAPSMYTVEVLCWMGGHTLQIRWYQGSPIKKRFPTSSRAPTLHEPIKTRMVIVERPKPLARLMPKNLPSAPARPITQTGVIPLSMRRIVRDQEAETDGCDERCTALRYIDPDDINGPVHVTTRHSAEAHNAFMANGNAGEQIYEWPGLRLDFATMTVYVDGQPARVSPTVKEWQLLRVLALNNGTVVKQEKLLTAVWGPEYIESHGYHLLRVNVARLRPKLSADAASNPERFIITKPGLGYMMRPAETEAKVVSL